MNSRSAGSSSPVRQEQRKSLQLPQAAFEGSRKESPSRQDERASRMIGRGGAPSTKGRNGEDEDQQAGAADVVASRAATRRQSRLSPSPTAASLKDAARKPVARGSFSAGNRDGTPPAGRVVGNGVDFKEADDLQQMPRSSQIPEEASSSDSRRSPAAASLTPLPLPLPVSIGLPQSSVLSKPGRSGMAVDVAASGDAKRGSGSGIRSLTPPNPGPALPSATMQAQTKGASPETMLQGLGRERLAEMPLQEISAKLDRLNLFSVKASSSSGSPARTGGSLGPAGLGRNMRNASPSSQGQSSTLGARRATSTSSTQGNSPARSASPYRKDMLNGKSSLGFQEPLGVSIELGMELVRRNRQLEREVRRLTGAVDAASISQASSPGSVKHVSSSSTARERICQQQVEEMAEDLAAVCRWAEEAERLQRHACRTLLRAVRQESPQGREVHQALAQLANFPAPPLRHSQGGRGASHELAEELSQLSCDLFSADNPRGANIASSKDCDEPADVAAMQAAILVLRRELPRLRASRSSLDQSNGRGDKRDFQQVLGASDNATKALTIEGRSSPSERRAAFQPQAMVQELPTRSPYPYQFGTPPQAPQQEELQDALFNLLDFNRDGKITREELAQALRYGYIQEPPQPIMVHGTSHLMAANESPLRARWAHENSPGASLLAASPQLASPMGSPLSCSRGLLGNSTSVMPILVRPPTVPSLASELPSMPAPSSLFVQPHDWNTSMRGTS